MKKPAEWAAMVVLALLILFGILAPLWLEYRAMGGASEPPRKRVSSIDVEHAIYCPICGEEISLRHWHLVPVRPDRRPTPLFLSTLAATSWPRMDAPATPESRTEVHD